MSGGDRESLTRVFTVADAQALAITQSSTELTYGRLRAWALRVSDALREASVGEGDLVAIATTRPMETVVAMLGVWIAGAAYLPLNPEDPADRIQRFLPAANAAALLQDRETHDLGVDIPRVLLPSRPDDDATVLPTQSVRADSLAYVIYTSGSTGTPKGVEVGHSALATYLEHARRNYPGLDGVVSLHSSLAFDLAVTSVLGPLTSGGCVDVIPSMPTLLRDGGRPSSTNPQGRRRFIKITPGHVPYLTGPLTYLIDAGPPEIVIGGEALTSEDVEQCRRTFPDSVITNEYGPTEAAVGCSTCRLEPGDPIPEPAIPIGAPVDSTTLYVVDDDGHAVRRGDSGELFIGGAQLAWGYRNQPRETAARFQPNPGGPSGSRRYRTGDIVRELEDGQLTFLGRTDEQVKVRGYRVELEEVRHALLRQPAVTEAVIVARPLQGGGFDLMACVCLKEGDAEHLHETVSATLPPPMRPRRIIEIENVPLDDNGKVDRSSLMDL